MGESWDVIVIGGGIAGISVAARLAATRRTLVIEAERQPGYHATGRSAAYFAPAYGNDVVRAVTAESESFFHSPPAGFSDAPLIRRRASLFVAGAGRSSGIDSMLASNTALERVDGDGARQIVGCLKPNCVAAGAFDPGGGDLDVDALLQAFLRLFRKRGGELRCGTPCESIARSGDSWQVNGTLSASVVVNAAGAWADEVATRAGIAPMGLTPMRRTACLLPAPDIPFTDWPLVIDVDEQFYFKPDAGALLLSPADETPSPPCDAAPEELDIAIRAIQVAALDVSRITHKWAGLRTFAPDRTFVVGFDPTCDGFFWLAGQGGYGVQTAPGLSDIAARMITGQGELVSAERCDALREKLSPARFRA